MPDYLINGALIVLILALVWVLTRIEPEPPVGQRPQDKPREGETVAVPAVTRPGVPVRSGRHGR
jgi:hypothetical protein